MGDKDPKKRCFHCVFTNFRGTDGALGSLTPELLMSLFASGGRRRGGRRGHYAHRYHHKHKRARIGASSSEQITSGTSERRVLQSAETSNSSQADKSSDLNHDVENQSSDPADEREARKENSSA